MSVEMKDIQTIDVVKGVSEALINQIPVANFFLTAIDNVRGNVLQRKFEEWQEMVGNRLSTLEKTVFDNLGNNETFATTLLKTSELAAHSSKKKNEYLANATLFAATNEINEDYLIICLNCMAKYTLSHLLMLHCFHEPSKYMKADNIIAGSALNLFHEAFPKFDKSISNLIIKDLYSDGFFNTDAISAMSSSSGILAKRTTKLGDLFLELFGINSVEV